MLNPRSPVNTWKQSGRLFLWRFTENTRNFPGWHFMVDRAAAASLSELLKAMARGTPPCFRGVVVSLPTAEVLAVPNNRHSGCVAPEKLRVELDPEDADSWAFEEEGAVLHWRMGAHKLQLAADVFGDPVKYFDSSIGKSPALWSWGLLT